MTPPLGLLASLSESHDAGVLFEEAWPVALARALALAPSARERAEWVQAFAATRKGWESAHRSDVVPRVQRAL